MSAIFLTIISLLLTPSMAAIDTFVFGGCTQFKYSPGSPYGSNVNSLLTSLVNSATVTIYNNFTVSGVSSSSSHDTVYGLYQCRGDLSAADCAGCVAKSVSQLGTLCVDSTGGALQLEGCFVKYDNASFIGVEDKTVVVKKCGPAIGYGSDELTRRDAVLDYLNGGGGGGIGSYKTYRTAGSGDVYGVGQCVQDLSGGECQDCLSDAIARLKAECGSAASGDVYLAKCYARYSISGAHSSGPPVNGYNNNGGGGGINYNNGGGGFNNGDDNNNDNETEKTLAILIGLIAAVALLILFLSCFRKMCEKGKGCK